MLPAWFTERGYKHFDVPVGERYVQAIDVGSNINGHVWSPLIRYEKRVKRYKPKTGKTVYKQRPIMYASHKDACILSKYAADLTSRLDILYDDEHLSSHVIGYRKLGRSNYHFSSDAYRFAKSIAPCVVLCFDISGFFDHLDHSLLKMRLKNLIGTSDLDKNWYKVLRQVTKYHYINRDLLAAHPKFGPRLKSKRPGPIASIAEIKSAGIPIVPNPHAFGIPQGTPISSAFSNLYMLDVDRSMASICGANQALYQRYSDDILVICKIENEALIQSTLMAAIKSAKLDIQDEKTERALFDGSGEAGFQYLGFNISESRAVIRPGSLARQMRKIKSSIKRTLEIGKKSISEGRSDKIYTKRLRRRFYPVGMRNFSSYARRAAKVFKSKAIVRQVIRLERYADKAIRDLKR